MATITPNIVPVTLAAGVAQKIVSKGDRVFAIVNIGTGRATLGSSSAVVDGAGHPLAAADMAGNQGGGFSFTEGTTLGGDLWAISAAGTVLSYFAG